MVSDAEKLIMIGVGVDGKPIEISDYLKMASKMLHHKDITVPPCLQQICEAIFSKHILNNKNATMSIPALTN